MNRTEGYIRAWKRSRTLRTTKVIQPIRVGFLGTGYIADWHAKALSTIPAVSLNAVCDKDGPRAQAFGQHYGVSRWYESLDAMLGDVELDLDVVHLRLSPLSHYQSGYIRL